MLDSLALPTDLALPHGSVTVRRAAANDLQAIMRLLADDPISAARGDANSGADEHVYARALAAIVDDPSNELIVVVAPDGEIVGTLQLTSIPGMARRGSTRLLVEAVRVAGDRRSEGIGGAVMHWVMDAAAPALGASLVKLTSDAARTDAHRFYRRLGFAESHIGFTYRVAG